MRSAEYFSTLDGRNEFPDFACLRRVTNPGNGETGLVVLDRPIPAEIATPYVALANFPSATMTWQTSIPTLATGPGSKG